MTQAKKDNIKADGQTANKTKADTLVMGYLVAKSRHGAHYRRCGRLFGAQEVKIAVEDLSENEINHLNNDPHLLVNFEAAE